MSIQSPCSIVFIPWVGGSFGLVTIGGWLAELPVMEASQGVFESDGVNLDAAFFRPLAGVQVTLSFTTEEDHPDLATALDAFLAADTREGRTILTLRGQVQISGRVGTFLDCVVTVVTPELPSGPAATTRRAFTVRTSIPYQV